MLQSILLFLAVPSLIHGFGEICLSNNTVENTTLDVNATAAIDNTIVELIAELEDWDFDDCSDACCDTLELEDTDGCSIAEFDTKSKICRLYKSNCSLSTETCIFTEEVSKRLTFISMAVDIGKSSNAENSDNNEKSYSSNEDTESSSNKSISGSGNESNATVYTTFVPPKTTPLLKMEIEPNVTYEQLGSETRENISNANTNYTDVSNSNGNSTKSFVNDTEETPNENQSNVTNDNYPPTKPPETSDVSITTVFSKVQNGTESPFVVPDGNNTANNTTESLNSTVLQTTNKNESSTVTGEEHKNDQKDSSENLENALNTTATNTENQEVNKTNNISMNGLRNTEQNQTLTDNRTSTPYETNTTEVKWTLNVSATTQKPAELANDTTISTANSSADNFLNQRTNETAEQTNTTENNSINTTKSPMHTTEKTIITTIAGERNATELKTLSTEAPALTTNKPPHGEVLNKTEIPAKNATMISPGSMTTTGNITKDNVTIPVSMPEGFSSTVTITNDTSTQSSTRFHYPHFESSESAAVSGALIAAVSFGVIFLFSVLVLLGKRCFDAWHRRHYSRMDYLVNGMYN